MSVEWADERWRQLLAAQIRDHSRLFFKLAFGVLRDADAAEDVLQHALLQAWEQRDRIADAAALKAWLSRTVVNGSLAILRRRATERRALGSWSQLDAAHPARVDDPMALRESVVLALGELTEQTQAVVVLRLMRGMSGNETAEALGCSASEVSRRLHAGMDQLRHALADWQDSVGA